MATPLTKAALVAASMQRARVIDVDPVHFTCTVATEYTQKPLTWISWASPYGHPNNGEGVFVMPEVGSICWLCEPSDGGMPFIVAFTSLEEKDGSHRNGRPDMNPGDIYLGTRDENHLWLRRGGVVEIGSTPLCQRLFIPVDNIIKDFCENYSLNTFGGSLDWTVSIPEKTAAQLYKKKHRALLRLQAREFAEDTAPIATLQIGSHETNEDAILTLALNESGTKGAAPRFNLTLRKTGDMQMVVKKGVTSPTVSWDIEGKIDLHSTENATLASDLTAKLLGKMLASVEGAAVEIKATSGQVAVSAPGGVAVTGGLSVGTAGAALLKLTDAVIRWMVGHKHISSAPGQFSGPPLDPATNIPLVPSMHQTTQLKST